MNTPDLAPKDGDFVAYIEELERRQLRANLPHGHAAPSVVTGKSTAAGMSPNTAANNNASLAAAAATVKAIPIGLVAIGLVLVIAGAVFQGGIVVVLIGVALLWQAARTVIRNARTASEGNKAQAAQQVSALLAAHAQQKRPSA